MSQAVQIAVVGAHLTQMPLHHELTERGAVFVRSCRTCGEYSLFALAGTSPPKPGLIRRPGFRGEGIEVEVWSLSLSAFGDFVAKVPSPMTIATVTLEDGSCVKGFCCEPHALEGALDITRYAGWKNYLAASMRA